MIDIVSTQNSMRCANTIMLWVWLFIRPTLYGSKSVGTLLYLNIFVCFFFSFLFCFFVFFCLIYDSSCVMLFLFCFDFCFVFVYSTTAYQWPFGCTDWWCAIAFCIDTVIGWERSRTFLSSRLFNKLCKCRDESVWYSAIEYICNWFMFMDALL